MNKIIGIVVSVAMLGMCIGLREVSAQRDEMPVGYPQSIEPELQALLGRLRDEPSSPELLVKVASTYFDLADDLLTIRLSGKGRTKREPRQQNRRPFG